MINLLRKIDNNSLEMYLKLGYVLPSKIAKAVVSRQKEFAAGRVCAGQALHKLLGEKVFVGQDSKFRPVWPAGIVGSISHTKAYVAVAVDYKCDHINIGIDIECLDNSPTKLASINNLVITDKEYELIGSLVVDNIPREHLSYLIFSIKEAAFKCINPLYDIYFDFKDVVVSSIDINNNRVFLSNNNKLASINLNSLECYFSFINQYKLIYTKVRLPTTYEYK